jgi:hypothetical protein
LSIVPPRRFVTGRERRRRLAVWAGFTVALQVAIGIAKGIGAL